MFIPLQVFVEKGFLDVIHPVDAQLLRIIMGKYELPKNMTREEYVNVTHIRRVFLNPEKSTFTHIDMGDEFPLTVAESPLEVFQLIESLYIQPTVN